MATRQIPSIAICAIVRNEAEYIKEWVDFHRKQGVDTFIIYDNDSIDNTKDMFRNVGIHCLDWEYRGKHFSIEQLSAYENARSWLEGKCDWVAYIDIDEFIFGRHGQTLAEALSKFKCDVSAIAVQQRVFGSSHQKKHDHGNVIDRFTRCAPSGYHEHFWFKTISRPECVTRFDSVHSVVVKNGRYVMVDGSALTGQGDNPLHPGHPGVTNCIFQGNIGLHHYPLKSWEEFMKKRDRWSNRDNRHDKTISNYWDKREMFANIDVCVELVGYLDI